MQFTILMLFGLLMATSILSLAAGIEHRWRRGPPRPHPLLQDGQTLKGEALFATGVDPSTVVFDCLVAPQVETFGDAAVFRPLPVRAHHRPSEEQVPLSTVVRSWADGGQRVFIELPSLDGPLTAKLSCGEEAVVVDIDNNAEVWRALAAVG